jgi:hypothetical protein
VPPNPTFIDELKAAARGSVALLIGDRGAANYFDFSLRGLCGSAIAFLLATALNAYLPALLGMQVGSGTITRGLLMVALLLALQIAFSAIVLRQLKRLDGFVPYLVADNWVTFFITLLSTGLMLFGVSGDVAIIGIGILVIVVEINIARLIVTLSPLQIAMFLIAQLVGVSIGLLIYGMVMPLPPDAAAELAASLAQ